MTNLETISWEAAWEALHAFMPEATYCTPGSLWDAAERAGMLIRRIKPHPVTDEGDYAVFRKLLGTVRPEELIILVTDVCFRKAASPFIFRASASEQFADEYWRANGEFIFSGFDVVIFCPESRILILWHHEGELACVTPQS